MRPLWTRKLGQNNTISIEKEDIYLGVETQDNLSPEKVIEKIFGDTFVMQRNIRIMESPTRHELTALSSKI